MSMLQRIARVLRFTQLLALLAVMGSAGGLYAVLVEFENAGRWVEHTHTVIDEINTVRLESLRAGMWLRNFAVVPRKESLQRVQDTGDYATAAAQRLLALTVDNPAQHHTAEQLQRELDAVLREYLHAAGQVHERDGQAALQAAVAAIVARDAARELRRLLDAAEGAERELLRQRSDVEAERYAALKQLLGAVCAACVLFMLWALRYSGRLLRLGHQQVHQLQADALHDPLTGLLNRRGLERQLAALGHAPRDEALQVAVLAFDLDGFKPVNDRYSHAAGDRVLQEVARRLCRFCREGDAVARVGGDEFIVVLRSVCSRQEATDAARRIRGSLMAPIELGGAVARIGASMGVAMLHEDGADMDALLQAADEQMYAAKRKSKGRTEASERLLEPAEL